MMKRSAVTVWLVGLCAASALMVGCSTTSKVHDAVDEAAMIRDQARSVTIRRGDGSGVASWEDVVADMASADVVLFGEMHGHELGLAVARELWEDILVSSPDAVLAMEFYERDQQIALDDYLSGVTNREQFEKAARKDKGNNPAGHIGMIEAAKDAGRPVIAANAARRYVTMARKEGYDRLGELSELQKGMFDLPIGDQEGGYKDRFMKWMGEPVGHDNSDVAKGMFRGQSVWDATMGASVAQGTRMGSPVGLVVGLFHVQFGNEAGGSGLIDQVRLYARRDLGRELRIVTIIQLARDDQALFRGRDAVVDEDGEEIEEADESDFGISDYVVYVGAREE